MGHTNINVTAGLVTALLVAGCAGAPGPHEIDQVPAPAIVKTEQPPDDHVRDTDFDAMIAEWERETLEWEAAREASDRAAREAYWRSQEKSLPSVASHETPTPEHTTPEAVYEIHDRFRRERERDRERAEARKWRAKQEQRQLDMIRQVNALETELRFEQMERERSEWLRSLDRSIERAGAPNPPIPFYWR